MFDASGLSNPSDLIPEEENFRIRTKIDILHILRNVMRKNMLITLYFDTTNRFILTSVLDIEENADEIIIDCGANPRYNRLASASTDLTFVTSLDRIKIEFKSTRIRTDRAYSAAAGRTTGTTGSSAEAAGLSPSFLTRNQSA